MDLFAAPLLLHEQAIYLHESVQYHVDRLDWDERKAYVRRVDIDYYTDADLGVTLKVLDVADETDAGAGGTRARGEVMVAWHVTMFKKIKFHTHENVGWGPVNLPESQMHTAATWLVLPDEAVTRFDRETLDGALIGLARLARNTAPLLLMCDARDLGVQAQAQSPFTGKPDPVPVRRHAGRRGPDRATGRPVERSARDVPRRRPRLPVPRGVPRMRGTGGRGGHPREGRRHRAADDHVRRVRAPHPVTTLAERLAAVRDERGHAPAVARRNDDVATRLASWNGARLVTVDGGRVALVERRIPLPAAVTERLRATAPTCYFDTESTGLSTGAGHGDHPGRGRSPRRRGDRRPPGAPPRLSRTSRPCSGP